MSTTTDLDFLLRDAGTLVALGPLDAETAYGLVDEYDEDMLSDGDFASVAGANVRITLRKGALSVVQEGSELTFNGGVYRVVQVYEVDDGEVLHAHAAYLEPDMTEATVRSLVHTMLMSPEYGRFELDRAVGSQGGTNLPGLRTAGFSEKVLGLSHYIASPAGAANRIFEVCKDFVVNPAERPGPSAPVVPTFTQRCTFGMLMNAPVLAFGPPTGECLQGIEIGSFGTTTPFQTNYVNGLYGPVIQFRYNFTRQMWELLVWDNDSENPPIVIDSFLNLGNWLADTQHKWIVIDYIPAPGGESVVRGYLNGQLAVEYSGDRLQNLYASSTARQLGYFLTSGATGSVSLPDAGFLDSRYWLPDTYAYPTPANPVTP